MIGLPDYYNFFAEDTKAEGTKARSFMEHNELENSGSVSPVAGNFYLAGWLRSDHVRRSVQGYFVLIMLFSLYFAQTRGVSYRLVPCAILPGFCLSLALAGFERVLLAARRWLESEMRGVQAGFVLFFASLIGNILFSSLLLSMPLCWVMENLLDQSYLCKEFALFSVNYSFVLAMASWLRWFYSSARPRARSQEDDSGGFNLPWRKHLTIVENLVYFRVFISQVIQRGKRTGAHSVR
jgi:hypothetical protein